MTRINSDRRIALGPDIDADHVDRRRQQPRDQPGDQKPGHRLLGNHRVDHHQDAGRDQRGEGSRRRDAAGAEALVVAEPDHLGHGDLGEHRGVDDGRAAGSTKGRGGECRRHRQPAWQPAQPVMRGPVEVGGQARLGRQRAHQDEQRDHRQGEGIGGAERNRRELRPGSVRSDGEIHAEQAAEAQRDPDMNTHRQHQGHHRHHDDTGRSRIEHAPRPS